MRKVLYIMGTGRSGSTALGIALGNLGPVFYAGEVFSWTLFRGIPRSEKAEVLAFWERVARHVPGRERWFDLPFHLHVEHHRALLTPWRSARLDAEYAACSHALFEAIAAESGADVIADSSHYALRAWKLRRDPRLEVTVLHLLRDPRSVISALRKPVQRHRPMSVLGANLYCWVVWVLSGAVYLAYPRPRRLRVRYEDFVADPRGVMTRVAGALGIPHDVPDYDHLATGNVFQGNRLRERETIAIRPQPSTDHLGRTGRWVSNALQLPLLALGGYLRRRARGGGVDGPGQTPAGSAESARKSPS